MEKSFWVYMMTNKPYETLYVGVTNDLCRRCYEHREGLDEGFSKKHGLKTLVWYSPFSTPEEAISYEKRIKKWRRDLEKQLIDKINPAWRDLYEEMQK